MIFPPQSLALSSGIAWDDQSHALNYGCGAESYSMTVYQTENVEYAIKAVVSIRDDRKFSVVLWDTDVNEPLPSTLVYNDRSSAIAMAERLTNPAPVVI